MLGAGVARMTVPTQAVAGGHMSGGVRVPVHTPPKSVPSFMKIT